MKIRIALATPARQEVIALEVPEGTTIAGALAQARAFERFPELAGAQTGIWGRVAPVDTTLRDGDRVELYRPASADAKAMRRERAGVRPSGKPRSGP